MGHSFVTNASHHIRKVPRTNPTRTAKENRTPLEQSDGVPAQCRPRGRMKTDRSASWLTVAWALRSLYARRQSRGRASSAQSVRSLCSGGRAKIARSRARAPFGLSLYGFGASLLCCRWEDGNLGWCDVCDVCYVGWCEGLSKGQLRSPHPSVNPSVNTSTEYSHWSIFVSRGVTRGLHTHAVTPS